jgi:hypothetical protein
VVSQETDAQDLAQGAFHLVLEDELPEEWQHREHRMRVMDLQGRVLTGGTPPDDRTPAVTAAWFHDGILLPGWAGSDPDVAAVTLWTERNRALDPEEVAKLAARLTPEQQEARLRGGFIHLAGLVLPGFTARPRIWCPRDRAPVLPVGGACPTCGTTRGLVAYRHVWDDADRPWPPPREWPIWMYADPHQARPTAVLWMAVDPDDCAWGVRYQTIAGDAATVTATVTAVEAAHGWTVVSRVMDPKITSQTNQFVTRHEGQVFSIGSAFRAAGLDFQDANTNFSEARDRILQAFEPDPALGRPRLRLHATHCRALIAEVERFTWDAGARRTNTNLKEQPGRRYSDGPACLRYWAMDAPTWLGGPRLRAGPTRWAGPPRVGKNPRTGW